jgi:hypothetical protein
MTPRGLVRGKAGGRAAQTGERGLGRQAVDAHASSVRRGGRAVLTFVKRAARGRARRP